jgi:type II secretory pathway component PulK
MKSNPTPPYQARSARRNGSALLLTILTVAVLLVVSLAFVAFVRVELRAVTNQQNLLEAQAQARMSMELAIGTLQAAAGADQRVTGTAALAGFTENRSGRGYGIAPTAPWRSNGWSAARPIRRLC